MSSYSCNGPSTHVMDVTKSEKVRLINYKYCVLK